jgi:thiamine-phosphate pyrophosphorylase
VNQYRETRKLMRGLYPILDIDSCRARGLDPIDVAERLLLTRPAMLQLRAKSASARETFDWLRALRPLTRAAGTLLMANDRPDLAQLAECDGVHLGQEDLPIAEARRFAPTLRVGISTHDLTQLHQALQQRPDYIAFGPIFPTRSKADAEVCVGVHKLTLAGQACRAAGIPLVAIGGIELERVAEVIPAADLIAVIGACMGADLAEVAARTQALNAAVQRAANAT